MVMFGKLIDVVHSLLLSFSPRYTITVGLRMVKQSNPSGVRQTGRALLLKAYIRRGQKNDAVRVYSELHVYHPLATYESPHQRLQAVWEIAAFTHCHLKDAEGALVHAREAHRIARELNFKGLPEQLEMDFPGLVT